MDQPGNGDFALHMSQQQTRNGWGGYFWRAGYEGNGSPASANNDDGYGTTGYSGGNVATPSGGQRDQQGYPEHQARRHARSRGSKRQREQTGYAQYAEATAAAQGSRAAKEASTE